MSSATRRYSAKWRTRKFVKAYAFLSFAIIFSNTDGKKLLDTASKIEIDALKAASKKAALKKTEATKEFIGKKSLTKLWDLIRILEFRKK